MSAPTDRPRTSAPEDPDSLPQIRLSTRQRIKLQNLVDENSDDALMDYLATLFEMPNPCPVDDIIEAATTRIYVARRRGRGRPSSIVELKKHIRELLSE